MPKPDWRDRPYLFHVHTAHTDGDLTVAQCVDFAEQAGASTVIFLEHIRRKPNYDVEHFAAEVKQAGRASLRTVVGFEAKLLPDGTLDLPDRCLEIAELVGIAEHGFPNDAALLSEAFRNVVRTYPPLWPQVTFVWVHPGLWSQKRRLLAVHEVIFREMLCEAGNAGILLEQNLRYGLLSPTAAARLSASRLVIGADAHSSLDLERWAECLHNHGREDRGFEAAHN